MQGSNKRLIHLHIPKTAGTSFYRLLQDNYGDQVCPYRIWAELEGADLSPWRVFSGHWGIGVERYLEPDSDFITILRHPIERTISEYEYLRRMAQENPQHPDKIVHIAARQTFWEWTNDPERPRLNGQTLGLISRDYENEANFNANEANFYKLACDVLDRCKVVGIVEYFNESVGLMAQIFGWKATASPKENIAARRIQISELSPSIAREIIRLQKLDLAVYEYAKYRLKRQLHAAKQINSVPTTQISEPTKTELLVQKYMGIGWYPQETNAAARFFHWTGPGNVSELHAALPQNTRKIKIHILRSLPEDGVTSLQLKINSEPVPLSHFGTDEVGIIMVGDINSDILDEINEITLSIRATLSATTVNRDDRRFLGLAIHSILCTSK